jgi:hypothetical protein
MDKVRRKNEREEREEEIVQKIGLRERGQEGISKRDNKRWKKMRINMGKWRK